MAKYYFLIEFRDDDAAKAAGRAIKHEFGWDVELVVFP